MKRPAISRAELNAMLVRRRQRLDEAKAEDELRNLRGIMSEAVSVLAFGSIGMTIDEEPAWVAAARKVRARDGQLGSSR
jgi:hypothetical protein